MPRLTYVVKKDGKFVCIAKLALDSVNALLNNGYTVEIA
jgi:hypothetical protein